MASEQPERGTSLASPQGKTGRYGLLLRYGLGFAVATAATWIVCAVFCDSLRLLSYEWSDSLGMPVRKGGSTVQWRSEGWATSRIGNLGVSVIPDIASIADPKVMVWGDSFVEGFQVADRHKLPETATDLLRSATGANGPVAAAVGHSGQCVADYYFQIPRYEKALTNIVQHVIVFAAYSDLLPDGPGHTHARFTASPRYAFVPDTTRPDLQLRSGLSGTAVDRVLNLQFLRRTAGILRGGARQLPLHRRLRFRVGPIRQSPPEASSGQPADGTDGEAFGFVLTEMRAVTDVPITFVYCPPVPLLRNGRAGLDDPEPALTRAFAKLCAGAGIGFVDMTPVFARLYEKETALARGFSNSVPGRGHFNRTGHRLVAEAIAEHVLRTNPCSSVRSSS